MEFRATRTYRTTQGGRQRSHTDLPVTNTIYAKLKYFMAHCTSPRLWVLSLNCAKLSTGHEVNTHSVSDSVFALSVFALSAGNIFARSCFLLSSTEKQKHQVLQNQATTSLSTLLFRLVGSVNLMKGSCKTVWHGVMRSGGSTPQRTASHHSPPRTGGSHLDRAEADCGADAGEVKLASALRPLSLVWLLHPEGGRPHVDHHASVAVARHHFPIEGHSSHSESV